MKDSVTSTNTAYYSIPGDPKAVRIYTLSNGMKVYTSVLQDAPRIFTNIAVRAGSKNDPADTTGLAHYLEHLLFKGTDKIGALDWSKEAPLLQQVADLYEAHRIAQSETERREIYTQIDQVSQQAAAFVAANEYDRLVSAIGAKRTNAYTWVDQTVYVNDIPSNELERWMQLESERFNKLVLRLFHTELETVYEEFNISQDKDFRKVSKALNKTLFPSHPYGTQTTLGEGEHLKKPSHYNIQRFFQTYYVPNNMAIILAGDFNPDQAVELAERYFGQYRPQAVPGTDFPAQPSLESPERRTVYGQEAAYLEMGWKFPGANWAQLPKLDLIKAILFNKKAGLIDQHLLQQQQVLSAAVRLIKLEDYTIFRIYGKPRQGQSLEEVERLLLEQVESLKQGDFEEWLLEAVVNEYRLYEYRSAESNDSRVHMMTTAFILGLDWAVFVQWLKALQQVTKQDLVDFANTYFKDNYVVVYKEHGPDPDIKKVDKPPITPVPLNRQEHSTFAREFLKQEVPIIQPVFPNYKQEIYRDSVNNLPVSYVRNETTPLFSLDFLFEKGRNHDPLLPVAMGYLPFTGTDRYSAQELNREFFRLGVSLDQSANNRRSYFNISGLGTSFAEGLALLEHRLRKAKPDREALEKYVEGVFARRANLMKDKQVILRNALFSYAKYGPQNPFTNILSAAELKALHPEPVLERLQNLLDSPHDIFYYGQETPEAIVKTLQNGHRVPAQFATIPHPKTFNPLEQEQPSVLFVDFPMVQVELMLLSKGTSEFSLHEHIFSNWYNSYFGSGLSSVVFQEIRESKGLAYSTYAS
ncbi:MAG: insulinase family protein, partial [Phaeodactylibacter sp.]|nr:insulinase family protein [Phaeodactylibacter sp.]